MIVKNVFNYIRVERDIGIGLNLPCLREASTVTFILFGHDQLCLIFCFVKDYWSLKQIIWCGFCVFVYVRLFVCLFFKCVCAFVFVVLCFSPPLSTVPHLSMTFLFYNIFPRELLLDLSSKDVSTAFYCLLCAPFFNTRWLSQCQIVKTFPLFYCPIRSKLKMRTRGPTKKSFTLYSQGTTLRSKISFKSTPTQVSFLPRALFTTLVRKSSSCHELQILVFVCSPFEP